ncbi:hypothetical protein WMW72_29745 [Paenibacillus filicis]|uniref:Uncharacterized protein n=1 Tax=Paenibacillus filicis TaxID=669464 RepID=A0ABU9DWD7_9BACL
MMIFSIDFIIHEYAKFNFIARTTGKEDVAMPDSDGHRSFSGDYGQMAVNPALGFSPQASGPYLVSSGTSTR